MLEKKNSTLTEQTKSKNKKQLYASQHLYMIAFERHNNNNNNNDNNNDKEQSMLRQRIGEWLVDKKRDSKRKYVNH